MNKNIIITIIVILTIGIFVGVFFQMQKEKKSLVAQEQDLLAICDKIEEQLEKDRCYLGVVESLTK